MIMIPSLSLSFGVFARLGFGIPNLFLLLISVVVLFPILIALVFF